MDLSPKGIQKIIDGVRKRISNNLCLVEAQPNRIVLRADVKNLLEASNFVGGFERATRSRFRVSFSKTTLNRTVIQKKWVCRREPPKHASKCESYILISIKKVSKQGLLNDPFLRRDPPFQATITIDPNHSHPLLEFNSVKYLKISSPVTECFFEYFKRGIQGAQAKHFHEENLKRVNYNALDDASMNPSLKAICALHKKWLKAEWELKETVRRHKISSKTLLIKNIETNTPSQSASGSSLINSNIACKYEIDESENADSSKIPTCVLNNIEEDIKPIVEIKQEIVSDNDDDSLPVIESYGSLAKPSTSADTSAKDNSTKAEIIVFHKSLNAYKIVKYLAGDFPDNSSITHLPRTLLPVRVDVHRAHF